MVVVKIMDHLQPPPTADEYRNYSKDLEELEEHLKGQSKEVRDLKNKRNFKDIHDFLTEKFTVDYEDALKIKQKQVKNTILFAQSRPNDTAMPSTFKQLLNESFTQLGATLSHFSDLKKFEDQCIISG